MQRKGSSSQAIAKYLEGKIAGPKLSKALKAMVEKEKLVKVTSLVLHHHSMSSCGKVKASFKLNPKFFAKVYHFVFSSTIFTIA